MLWAAFTTCFFGFMRAGEICSHNVQSIDATADLLVEDVTVDNIWDPKLVKIYLKKSKTDQFREGIDVYIARTYCKLYPVAALLSWLVVCSNSLGVLFRFSSGKPLTRSAFVQELISATCRDPSGFSGHSFCSEAAITAAMKGISDSNIKLLGRWKSSTYHRYIQPSHEWLGFLASKLTSKSDSGISQSSSLAQIPGKFPELSETV